MPASDELLLKLIYQEENKKVLSDASVQLETMTQAEKDLSKQNAALSDSGEKLAKSSEGIAGGFSKAQATLVTFQAGLSIVKQGLDMVGGIVDSTIGKYERYGRQVMLLSNNLGLTADETSRLIQVSDDYGISVETVTSALEMMVRRGTAPSIEELAKIADQYTAIEDPIKRAALMTELLGRGWTSLTPLLKDGGQAIRDNSAAIADNLIITEADIQKTEELRKAKDALNDRVEGLSLKIGELLTPAANKVVESLDAWLEATLPATTEEGRLRQEVILAANAFGDQSDQTRRASDALQDYLIQLSGAPERINAVTQSIIDLNNSQLTGAAATKAMIEKATGQRFTQTKAPDSTATDLTKLSHEEQQAADKAYEDFQTKLSDIELKGGDERKKIVSDTADQIDKLEADSGQKRLDIIGKFVQDEADRLSDAQDKRIDILTSYAEAEQQITEQQNRDRLALAQSFGLETERMEQDHQRNMQRLSEDHGRRMSRLADSRDALGIEDEQANYEIEARRAEEDYQTTASRKNEDYARQLAELNASAEEQRQARARDKDKQLTDLNEQFVKQDTRYKAAYQKQLDDLTKSTGDQAQKVKEAEYNKLQALDAATKAEHDKAVTEWETWRKDHSIFLEGEKALYDDYLKHLHDQLQLYMNGGTATTTPTGAPFRASGGPASPFGTYIVGEHGPEVLRMGNRGGYVEANGGNQFKVEIIIGGTNAALPDIKAAVYQGIKEVMQAAQR